MTSPRSGADDDILKREVERQMREAASNETMMLIRKAVAVALEMVKTSVDAGVDAGVLAERERCAKNFDHILMEGGISVGDAIRKPPTCKTCGGAGEIVRRPITPVGMVKPCPDCQPKEPADDES